MDVLSRERFGSPGPLAAELPEPTTAPTPLNTAQLDTLKAVARNQVWLPAWPSWAPARWMGDREGRAPTQHVQALARRGLVGTAPFRSTGLPESWRRVALTSDGRAELDRFARADARLAEARRAGHDDSWWEDDIDA